MRLLYRAGARLDLEEARDWYGSTSPALEQRFAKAVDETLERMLAWPLAFRVVYRGEVRRALVPGFPYQVFFRLRGEDAIVVLAVTHTSRHPRHWRRQASELD